MLRLFTRSTVYPIHYGSNRSEHLGIHIAILSPQSSERFKKTHRDDESLSLDECLTFAMFYFIHCPTLEISSKDDSFIIFFVFLIVYLHFNLKLLLWYHTLTKKSMLVLICYFNFVQKIPLFVGLFVATKLVLNYLNSTWSLGIERREERNFSALFISRSVLFGFGTPVGGRVLVEKT